MSRRKNNSINGYVDGFRLLGRDYRVSNNTLKTLLNNNDLIVGTPGTGKSRGYIKALLDNISENMIVVDTKGVLYKEYRESLLGKGYAVRRLNFNDCAHSIKYNPLDFISYDEKTGSYNCDDIISLAHTICPDSLATEDLFWLESARNMIQAVIALVMETSDKEGHNILSVLKIFESWNYDVMDRIFSELESVKPGTFAYSSYMQARSVSKAERTDSCIRSFVSAAMRCFSSREVQKMLGGKSEISFEDFSDKKNVLFIDISDNDRSKDTLVTIFYTQLFQSLIRIADKKKSGRLGIPLRVIMDDFASGVKVPNLDGIINVIRSRGISMSIIIQSLDQLASIYGVGEAVNIRNACDHSMFLGSKGPEDIEFFARLANMDVIELTDKLGLTNMLICERGVSHGIIVPKYNFGTEYH
jgi:Type IV secretory pathway, VirD4 components